MIRSGLNIIVLLLLLVGTETVSAQQWYHVEMIVFEHISGGLDNEDWYSDPGLPALINTVKPVYTVPAVPAAPAPAQNPEIPVAKTLVPYEILHASDYKLRDVYQTLRQLGDYRPQYHVAWLQPGQDGNRARSLHLQEDDRNSLYEITIPPLLKTEPPPLEFHEPVKLLLDGTVRIRSGSLLYVDLDIVLFRPSMNNMTPLILPGQAALSDVVIEEPAQYMRLTESRRLRLDELQYFDHPRLGVILEVTRYEPEPLVEPAPATTGVPGT